VLVVLRKHVEDSADIEEWSKKHEKEWLEEGEVCPVTGRAFATMDRRLDASLGGSGVPMYSAAYSAAFVVDAFFSDVEETGHDMFCCAPELDAEHMQAAESVIEHVGGKTDVIQFASLFTQGYLKKMHSAGM
jgi:hypothetical protein